MSTTPRNQRPLIGLSGRRTPGSNISSFPEALHDADIDIYFANYARGVMAAGGLAVYLPFGLDITSVVSELDGILLSGGTDISAQLYGAESSPDALITEDERDQFELELFNQSLEADLPVLGICRGHQLINVGLGGSLHQHVPEHSVMTGGVNNPAHSVQFTQNSKLAHMYGPSRQINSLHHQTIDSLGEGLEVTGTDSDGSIEAIEHVSLPIIGVQWHPEMMDARDDDPIFAWLIEEARKAKAS